MIRFTCACGNRLEAANDEVGLQAKCPACQAKVTVPESPETFRAGAASVPTAAAAIEEPRRRRPHHLQHDDDRDESAEHEPGGTSGKAIAALALGLLSFCFPIFLSIPAIILGALGTSEINRSRGRLGGKGMAIAGIVTGCVAIFVAPAIMIALLVPAVHAVREAAAVTKSLNNLKQISLAMHSYHDINKKLPQPAIYSKDGRPLLSWRVAILPFIGQDNLFRQFNLDESWDSPNNRPLLPFMPEEYRLPTEPPGQDKTHYQVFVGKNTIFRASSREQVRFADITDGTANTILVIEAADPVLWTKPEDLNYEPNRPLPRLGGHISRRTGMAMADASAFHKDLTLVSDQTLRNAITMNDGQLLGNDWFQR